MLEVHEELHQVGRLGEMECEVVGKILGQLKGGEDIGQ